MELKITELMSNYIDHEFSPAEDHETSVERIKAMTMEKMNHGRRKPVRKMSRSLLIAAVLVVALAVTALAVYQYSMADRVVENALVTENVYGEALYDYSAVGYNTAAEGASPMESIPEYLAYAELKAYDKENKTHDARELLPYEDPHRACYGYGYQPMADKIDEIAEKHGLRIWQQQAFVGSAEELCALLGIESFGVVEDDRCSASVYDDGGFELSGYSLAGQSGVGLNLNRAVKGTLSTFFLMGYDPADYTYENYTTASGVTVDLAFHEKDAMIFADMETCYVTAEVGTLQSMEELRSVADSIDFAILDTIDGDSVASAVAVLYAEQNSAASHGNKTSEKAEEVFALLGDRSLPVVPDGYYLRIVEVYAPEDSLDTLWQEFNDGCFANIHMSYESENRVNGVDTISLNYARYWGDVERTTSITQGQYDTQKALMQEECELNPHLFSSEITDCAVNGYEAFYYTGESSIALCWMDTENDLFYTLTAPMSFTPEAVITLAESVSLK